MNSDAISGSPLLETTLREHRMVRLLPQRSGTETFGALPAHISPGD
jgi:hypothetical protein